MAKICTGISGHGSVSLVKLLTPLKQAFQNQIDFYKRCGHYTNFRRIVNPKFKPFKIKTADLLDLTFGNSI